MSRIGNAPVAVPDKVKVEITRTSLKATGPKGNIEVALHPDLEVTQEDNQILIKRPTDHRKHRSLHGMVRALVDNAVTGVSSGFEKSLEINGVGYRAAMAGSTLQMNLGYSHQVDYPKPPDVEIEVKDQRVVTVKGIDKQRVGQVAAIIRAFKEPEPYKGTGIRYLGEHIRRKEGKAGA